MATERPRYGDLKDVYGDQFRKPPAPIRWLVKDICGESFHVIADDVQLTQDALLQFTVNRAPVACVKQWLWYRADPLPAANSAPHLDAARREA